MMVKISMYHNYSWKLQNSHVTPLGNDKSFLELICSFKLGLFNAISEASRIVRICFVSGATKQNFPGKLVASVFCHMFCRFGIFRDI